MREETMQMGGSMRRSRPRRWALGLIIAMSAATAGLALAGPAAANTTVPQATQAGMSTTSISTSQFVNQFDTEPYVGNGYFSQRIPAAGMGLLTGLGKIGWPLGTPRFTEALAAGLYAKTNASVAFYPTETKQVIALIPTWSTLTFTTPTGSTYAPATVKAAQIRGYRQTENLKTETVTTSGTWTAPRGHKQAKFTYQVFTDRARKHVGLVVLRLTPQWNGRTTVTGLLDGRGASRLLPAGAGVDLRSHTSHVSSTAIGTKFGVTESSTPRFSPALVRDSAIAHRKTQTAGERITFIAHRGRTYTFTKYARSSPAVTPRTRPGRPGRRRCRRRSWAGAGCSPTTAARGRLSGTAASRSPATRRCSRQSTPTRMTCTPASGRTARTPTAPADCPATATPAWCSGIRTSGCIRRSSPPIRRWPGRPSTTGSTP